MSTQPAPINTPSLQQYSDSLSLLHQRMDRFYAWASQLQVEHRDVVQRLGFLENLALEEEEGGENAFNSSR